LSKDSRVAWVKGNPAFFISRGVTEGLSGVSKTSIGAGKLPAQYLRAVFSETNLRIVDYLTIFGPNQSNSRCTTEEFKMNFKLKALAAALAVVAAAPVYAAQIKDGGSGNGDLFLSAWDPAALTSYTLNLNIPMQSFTGSSNLNFAPDANMATFLGSVTPANVLWNVVALDTTGSPKISGEMNYLFTSQATPTKAQTPYNSGIGNASQENTYVGSANILIGSGNSTVHTSTGPTDYGYADSGYGGDKFAGQFPAAFSNAGKLNQALNFYNITGTTGTTLTKATVTQFQGGTWTLSSNGTLNYAATSVPLPAAAWLFVSGLLGLVGVSRRKSIAS